MARTHGPTPPPLGRTHSGVFAALGSAFLLLLLALTATPVRAQSAATFNKRGVDAETRQDYDTAFEDFRQATLKKPGDVRYKTRYERVRFLAGTAHIDRGRVLKQSGDIAGALGEFLRAHEIDPGNQTADQEIGIIQRENPGTIPTTPGTAPPPVQNGNNAAPVPPTPAAAVSPTGLEQTPRQNETLNEIGSVTGPVQLKPVANDSITLHMVEDVRNIYQAIGKLAGINVLFDPDFQSKRIPVDLTNVSLSDALRIVGTIAGSFYKPVTPNTIFVAQNTRTKRTDLEELAVQTFYLTNAAQQNDANEITTALRNLLDPSTKVYLVPSQNAIVMRATPDQLLLAQKLLNDLDRARPEVVVDVAVLEVNRDKTRTLGITLPTQFGLTPQATTSTSSTATSSTGTSSGTTSGTTTTSNFTLNSLANLNATNFAVSVSGGTVNALLNDSDTRVLQNPRIRATDGQRATLKIGSRIPIATGSYNAGVSTGIASIGVQTQFTYLDVGVNIDMTPTVHYDREVTLKMKIEVSSQTGTVNISGVNEPIIGQRVIEQVIQLKEGEPSILAGILNRQDNRSVNGTPGLGEIPFFKFFFSTQSREVLRDEIVFLLIPHIVRESVLTRLNTRPIDTGTGQAIELRRDTSAEASAFAQPINPPPAARVGSQTTAANAAAAMVEQLRQQAQPLTPPASAATPIPATGNAPGSGPPVSLTVLPPASTQTVGSTFQVAVTLANARDLASVPLQLHFNPAVLSLVNVDAGDLLSRDGQPVSIVHRDEGNGLVTISTSRPPGVPGITGGGAVAVLTFKAIAAGDSDLGLTKVAARNSAQTNLPAVGSQSTVHVK